MRQTVHVESPTLLLRLHNQEAVLVNHKAVIKLEHFFLLLNADRPCRTLWTGITTFETFGGHQRLRRTILPCPDRMVKTVWMQWRLSRLVRFCTDQWYQLKYWDANYCLGVAYLLLIEWGSAARSAGHQRTPGWSGEQNWREVASWSLLQRSCNIVVIQSVSYLASPSRTAGRRTDRWAFFRILK